MHIHIQKTLIFFIKGKKPFLEKFEDLELLGFLEKSIKIKMIEMSNKSIFVDHPEDIKSSKKIKNLKLIFF